MPIDPAELSRRLEEAARMRAVPRRATLDLQALGRELLEKRPRGPERPGSGDARRR